MKSITVIRKKRGRPPTGTDPVSTIRLSQELRESVEGWASKQADKPSRSEAIRRILTDYLKRRGFIGKGE